MRTARLLLRPLNGGDVPAITAGVGNYEVAKWLSVVPYPYHAADARAFLASEHAAPGVAWAICDGRGLQGVVSHNGALGYWLARGAWGKGYLTEALDAVVDACFAPRRVQVLHASHFEGNDRSARVLAKQGFRYVGSREVQARAMSQAVTSRLMELDRATWTARRRYALATERLTLRELRDGDLKALMRIAGDPRVARGLSDVKVPWGEEAARLWLDRARFRGRPGFRAAICRRRRLIGTVGLFEAPEGQGALCELFVEPESQGRGFATEALEAFLADVLPRFAVTQVWAAPFADIPSAGAVLARAGFVPVGRGSSVSAARQGVQETAVWHLQAPAPARP
ncbi:GNAT family N-acetyltransferase [Oceaniglobus roseus]|uniref:GNAT family N-acetyltransferase n=1 Tax=Oceaniglobus roseus TaxID=1737570 RepID=UPI001561C570|nr:GNAT family N-acetyltransferase [Kandeliimicrobium roseum]